MYKQSIFKKIFIIGFYFILGIGIGSVTTIPLVMKKIIPDDSSIIMLIALPISIIFIAYQIITLINSIEIKEDSICVTTLFRKKIEYKYPDFIIQPKLGGFSMYGTPFIEYLKIKFRSKDTNKAKSFGFAGYRRKDVDKMFELLLEYHPELLDTL